MARKNNRKLFLFGRYSLALLLPKKWLSELGVERGQNVQLEYDRARRRIVLRFEAQSTARSETPESFTKTDKSSQSDLQPIPEL